MIKTPPMGWNSWNTFAENIDEQLIIETADKMVDEGLLDCGYEYLVIDDCWSLKERDENGRLVPDPKKFPSGIKTVIDYVHSKGLKFGMYSCAGNLTCAGYPGSFEHEFIDAQTFAEWGVDFLKYDYCYHSRIIHGKYLYRRMGLALKNCGRDILFSACTWGADNTHEWIRETGADMWRSTGDIHDSWGHIKLLLEKQDKILPYGGVGCFNDMDMLIVGIGGNGNVGMGTGLSDTQYKTHFAIWALFGSPLMIGNDIRDMSDVTRNLLKNKKLIEINQDVASRQLIRLSCLYGNENLKCYSKLLDNGEIAIGFFNLGEEDWVAKLNLDELGLPESTGKTLLMEDVFTGEQIKVTNGTFMHDIKAFDSLVYRAKVVDK